MPYTISGTTLTVSGTVDLTHARVPEFYQLNFAPGGASVTFSALTFLGVPPPGMNYTVLGSAAHDELTIQVPENSAGVPVNLSFFSFQNWGANDLVILEGNSSNNNIGRTYQNALLRGGDGDDTYEIHPGEIVDETGSGGIDTVRSYWSVNLLSSNFRGDIENVTLIAVDKDTFAIGNGLDNKLVGGLANNILNGVGGDDWMQGRRGNDTYVVNSVNDIVDEQANNPGGIDTVRSSVNYSLVVTNFVRGAVENLVLIGAAVTGEGNILRNEITGNAHANTLSGLGGNDVLDGAAGADVLQGGAGSDTYVLGSEASGVDMVDDTSGVADTITSSINRSLAFSDYSDIENLTLVGNAGAGLGNALANVMKGNARANGLYGFDGNDRLFGGDGGDRLAGGAGADQFIFNRPADSRTDSGRDHIVDFSRAEGDRIVLSAIDANTELAGNQAFTFIGSAAFSDKSGQLHFHRVAGHSIIEGDVDGDGVADFSIVSDRPVIFLHGDFVL